MNGFLSFLKDHFSPYVMILGLFSGTVCLLILSPRLKEESFPKESKVAKYGGATYIVLSIVLYLIGRFSR
jgi:hypothetical membrane protein